MNVVSWLNCSYVDKETKREKSKADKRYNSGNECCKLVALSGNLAFMMEEEDFWNTYFC